MEAFLPFTIYQACTCNSISQVKCKLCILQAIGHTSILSLCVCVSERVCAQSIFCDWGTSSLCSRCVCVYLCRLMYTACCLYMQSVVCSTYWLYCPSGFGCMSISVCIDVCEHPMRSPPVSCLVLSVSQCLLCSSQPE